MIDSSETGFDSKKTKIERLLDRVITALERTYPEQTSDAMEDYVGVLKILSPISNDLRIRPIIKMLKRLYVYPNRPEHNELLLEVHDLKELLHELRIDDVISTPLGAADKPRVWPWVLVSIISMLFILIPRS